MLTVLKEIALGPGFEVCLHMLFVSRLSTVDCRAWPRPSPLAPRPSICAMTFERGRYLGRYPYNHKKRTLDVFRDSINKPPHTVKLKSFRAHKQQIRSQSSTPKAIQQLHKATKPKNKTPPLSQVIYTMPYVRSSAVSLSNAEREAIKKDCEKLPADLENFKQRVKACKASVGERNVKVVASRIGELKEALSLLEMEAELIEGLLAGVQAATKYLKRRKQTIARVSGNEE
ncbi:hypothetical protein F4778DRAFT_636281 [Xylariomycetidae sp. FL2044]|nr:hypothetical protein F4778DRAFT_636281 [Xylariomycetidae sp. FL2044]